MTQDNGSNLLKATNEDTSGPFFPIYFQDESLEDLTVLGPGIVGGPSGQHIILCGRVLDRHGESGQWGSNGVLAGECKGHLQLACKFRASRS